MRALRYLLFMACLPICFFSGWVLRDVIDRESETGVLAQQPLVEQRVTSVFGENDTPDRTIQNISDAQIHQREVTTGDHGDSDDRIDHFAKEIVSHIRQRQFESAYRLLLQVKLDSSLSLDKQQTLRISTVFFEQTMDIGLDQYIASGLLIRIGEEVRLLDAYSSYAQFFEVLSKTDHAPEVALSDFDALSSYYQEQISERQLQLLEGWLLERVEQNFRSRQDWVGLDQWYSLLISRAADPVDIYRKHAALQFQQGRYMESLSSLDSVSQYASWSADDERLYTSIRERIDKEDVASIQLERVGGSFIASMRLNNNIPVRLLMDTGATISALDYRFADAYNIGRSGSTIRLATASGRVEADLLSIRSAQLGEFTVSDLEFASLDLGANKRSAYHGLLGMDILGQFEFYLDQREAILYLNVGGDLSESLFGF